MPSCRGSNLRRTSGSYRKACRPRPRTGTFRWLSFELWTRGARPSPLPRQWLLETFVAWFLSSWTTPLGLALYYFLVDQGQPDRYQIPSITVGGLHRSMDPRQWWRG